MPKERDGRKLIVEESTTKVVLLQASVGVTVCPDSDGRARQGV